MNGDRLLSPEEVADRLDVSPQTLANWRRDPEHELDFVNVGRLIRYRESDLEDFLDYLSSEEDDEELDDDEGDDIEDEDEDDDYEPR
jgi:excisionase family DNA binding protein